MKPKKNPNADLSKKRFLFFQIGLMLVLVAAWQALEMKTYAKEEVRQTFSVENNFYEEETVPRIVLPEKEIPKKQEKAPPKKNKIDFKIIDNYAGMEPNPIEFKTPPKSIAKIASIPTLNKPEKIEFPYIVVENVPVFPGCENLATKEEKKACMEEAIRKIVQKNFDKELPENLGLSGRNRIQVLFKIDRMGNVVDIEAKTTHPKLAEEARRVVRLFPKMKPGEQSGVPVKVSYSFPIILDVQ